MAICRNSLQSQDPWPVGFRFSPTDEELLNHYLKNKVFGNELLVQFIPQIDVYDFEPWDLPGLLNEFVIFEKLFFFHALDFKNSNGKRISRVTKAGFWKSTGHDREIRARGTNLLIGTKKNLVYYRGRAPNTNRTNWVIHQYRLHTDTPFQNLRPFVVCRLKKKSDMNVVQFDGPSDLATFENAITVNGIREYPPAVSHCTGQPALPDSQSINVSDYGVNRQPTQAEASESHFDLLELLGMCKSPLQPALPDFQPHPTASNANCEDDLMDVQPTNGINGEVNSQLVQPGGSEREINLTEYFNSVLENENNDEVTSRIWIDSYDRDESSNRLLGLQYDGFGYGTDNVAEQSNDIPPSCSYRYVVSETKSIKCFQSREDKKIYLHKALQGSSSGSIVSTRNVFSYIVTTKRIQHKSAHPLVYIAKAFLGIILFVVFALKLLLHSN